MNATILWDTNPILYVSFLFKIKFSIIKQDSDISNVKSILLLIAIEWNCIYGKS